ncbi:NAD(P)/FAD-dependent oxidoreductase [Pontibacter sp. MBLB2868]|uniref:NAD(P)/FAD-dependent oxidoreductase n=1 Tax=Pontibacter sp. MBLB2868 TaxID=3451555 RepID=UPI003F75317E
MEDVVIIGGGLAGLTSALNLVRAGIAVTVIEKKNYPFHRVCGEYISNEVLPYLRWLGADINALEPASISRFLLSSPKGTVLETKLDLGGFGLSRYTLDNYLYKLAAQQGVKFRLQTTVQEVHFANDSFTIELTGNERIQARIVLGAYGKRSALDRQLNRPFFKSRSPYIGVKYHLHYKHQPANLIALHNFKDGYAGISAVENGRYCFCYLTTRQNLRQHGSIPKMEQVILSRNPHLRHIFEEAEFLYPQPEVINEISFATKTCIEDHMLMCGDAAGMITPLCGNGMAMAIHAGKIASDQVVKYFENGRNRASMELGYRSAWKKKFKSRLQTGRLVQHLFGAPLLSELAVNTLRFLPPAVRLIMRQTHGSPF